MEQFDRQKPSLIPQVLRHVVKATGRTARTATLNTYLYIVVSMAHTYTVHQIVNGIYKYM